MSSAISLVFGPAQRTNTHLAARDADRLRAATRDPRVPEMMIADTDVLIDFLQGQGSIDRIALEIEQAQRFPSTGGARFG